MVLPDGCSQDGLGDVLPPQSPSHLTPAYELPPGGAAKSGQEQHHDT